MPDKERALLWINTATPKTNRQLSMGVYADDIHSCRDAISEERRAFLVAFTENDIADLKRYIARHGSEYCHERTLELARERLAALEAIAAA